jgi:hypothetical protein
MTEHTFTNKSNAARFAKNQIAKGTAPASEYSVEALAVGDGFVVVWAQPAATETMSLSPAAGAEMVETATVAKRTRTPRAAKAAATPSTGRAHSVRDGVFGLLRRPEGATVADIKELTGWKYTGSFLFGTIKKLGIELSKQKGPAGTVYRIPAADVVADEVAA